MTEEITGIDLVQSQIRIAGGATLAELGLASQADVPKPNGWVLVWVLRSVNRGLNCLLPWCGRSRAVRPSPGGCVGHVMALCRCTVAAFASSANALPSQSHRTFLSIECAYATCPAQLCDPVPSDE